MGFEEKVNKGNFPLLIPFSLRENKTDSLGAYYYLLAKKHVQMKTKHVGPLG